VRGLDIPNGYKIYVRPKEGGAEGEVEEEQFLLADSGVYEENGDQRLFFVKFYFDGILKLWIYF